MVRFSLHHSLPFSSQVPLAFPSMLLPSGFTLSSATVSASSTVFACSLPPSAALLSGHEFAVPQEVIEVIQGGWCSHIPLMALVSRLLPDAPTISTSSQALSSILDDKDEHLMLASDWSQAWPHLVEAIEQHLPSQERIQIAKMWKKHFKGIWLCGDWNGSFPLLLQYNIHVRKAYCNTFLNFDTPPGSRLCGSK